MIFTTSIASHEQKKATWAGLLAAAEQERDTAFYKLTQRDSSMMELYARYQACCSELDAIKTSTGSSSTSSKSSAVCLGSSTRLYAVSAEKQQVCYVYFTLQSNNNDIAKPSRAISVYVSATMPCDA
jgi:hypothetical protein